MAFVHLGTSVVPKDTTTTTTTPNEVDKNTTVAPTTKVNTASLSSIVEEPGVITTNVHVNQLSSANNNNAQCQAEKASALLQDVKNVQDETDHVHSPTLPPHNKGNLAEPNPIINEQMSLDNSLVAATAESQQPATAIILQTVESNTSTASNTTTEDTKPKLIQPTVVRKEKSIKTNSQQSQSPTTQQQATQKKADVDEGKAGISSGNFFT